MKRIAFFGKFNSGKSTLINSILGYKVVPEKVIPTHVPCVKIEYGSSFEIIGLNNNQVIYRTKQWNEFEKKMQDTKFSYVKVTNPHPFLKYGFSIWDTPGIDDINENYTNYAEKFLNEYKKEIDAAYFLVSNTAIINTELEFLKKVFSNVNEVVVLHTKADKNHTADTLKVITDFEKTIKNHIGIHPVVRAVSPKMLWDDSISNFFKQAIEFEVYEEKVLNVVKKFELVNSRIENLISEFSRYQQILGDAKNSLERTTFENKSMMTIVLEKTLSANQLKINDLLRDNLESNKKIIEKGLEDNLSGVQLSIITKLKNEAADICSNISSVEKGLKSDIKGLTQKINTDNEYINSSLKHNISKLLSEIEKNTDRISKEINKSSDSLTNNLYRQYGAQELQINSLGEKMDNNFFSLLKYSFKEFLFLKLSLSVIIIMQIIFLTKYFNLW